MSKPLSSKPWLTSYDENVPHTIEVPDYPIFDFLEQSAQKYPERLAIISQEGRWTFETFDQRTEQLAGAMLNAGLRKGDRVSSYDP